LFVWTTIVAVSLALVPLVLVDSWSAVQSPLLLAVMFTETLMNGGCLAAWLYAWKRIRGQAIPFPIQPGHWIALLLGFQFILNQLGMVIEMGLAVIEQENFLFFVQLNKLFSIGAYAVQAACWIIVFRAPLQHRAWKVCCGAFAVTYCWMIVRHLHIWLAFDVWESDYASIYWIVWLIGAPAAVAMLTAAVAAIVALVQDLVSWRQYDWLHWLGVGTLFSKPVLQLVLAASYTIEGIH